MTRRRAGCDGIGNGGQFGGAFGVTWPILGGYSVSFADTYRMVYTPNCAHGSTMTV
jgi:hypothetical protein